MIQVTGLYKGYLKEHPILKNVNLETEKGTIHGVIGQNGSGKTTLIKCLTGILRPDEGVVLYNGESVYDNSNVKEKIGYVADQNQFFGNYKVKEMVKFFAGIYPNFSKDDFNKLNEKFHVNVKKRVRQLSKGQQMRLSFMLAIAMNSEVMILDEPTSGLDVIAKKELLDILVSEVENNELTVIITSHHLHDLEKICDSITIINDGKVDVSAEINTVKEQVKKYQIVFPNGAPKEFYHLEGILHMSNMGSVYTLVLRDEIEAIDMKMKELGAILTEEMECGLEEAFIYLNREEREDEKNENNNLA